MWLPMTWFTNLRALLFLTGSFLAVGQNHAACPTNDTVIDLSNWTVVQYGNFGQGNANWVRSQTNTVALQTQNADASVFLSPSPLGSDLIEGSWRVETSNDDDFIGFVFGFQDDQHFYLFDWKQTDQVQNEWGDSKRGMSVKAISANSPLTAADFGTTFHPDPSRVRLLFHNDVVWRDNVDYDFSLNFVPGHFEIRISQGSTTLATISIDDSTYASGRFGFYNFSQSSVRYSGFTRRVVATTPVISVANAAIAEGDSGNTDLIFPISLSVSNCEVTAVDFYLSDGSAVAGRDYVSVAGGRITFNPGTTNQVVRVPVIGDVWNEANEVFFLTLQNPTNGTLGMAQAAGTILNDDPVPALTVADASTAEGHSGTSPLTFALALSAPLETDLMIQYATSNQTAVAPGDYISLAGALTIAAGETSGVVAVSVVGDTVVEEDERFVLCFQTTGPIMPQQWCAAGAIINDETNVAPVVNIIEPADGMVFFIPASIPIRTEVFDPDDEVTRVDFFAGSELLSTRFAAPFNHVWSDPLSGTYSLTAIAYDARGASGTSAPVRVTVRHCDPLLEATPLADQEACLCEQVIFQTVVTSGEEPAFTWRANGVPLPGQTNDTLILSSLKQEQAGTYTVEIATPCATLTRSATLTLRGQGDQNPVALTNAGRITLNDNNVAAPYPTIINAECIPGPIKGLAVTLDGLSHSFPDDVDVLLLSPSGWAVKLMSDAGGNGSARLTNVVLTFSDSATASLPDASRIESGIYAPTDFPPAEVFPAPASDSMLATNFSPLLGTDANGAWSLFVRDDLGGDAGFIARGWSLSIEWEDQSPLLRYSLRQDGRMEVILSGLTNRTHVIEASSDLQNWTAFQTNLMEGPVTMLIDPLEQRRFFRAVRCP